MRDVVIDTNIYTAFMKGSPEVKKVLDFTDNIYMPVVVLGELYYGFYKGLRYHENETLLRNFLAKDKVGVLDINSSVSRIYGQLKNTVALKGQTTASNDLWIAAICLERGLPLYSFDSDFNNIATLARIG